MAMSDKIGNIERSKRELFFMVRTLRDIYGDEDKLNKSIRKCAILGDGMSGLKKHPDKALEVFLPVILSYDKERVDFSSLYNSGKNVFKDAIDTLLERGVDEFCEELRKVR